MSRNPSRSPLVEIQGPAPFVAELERDHLSLARLAELVRSSPAIAYVVSPDGQVHCVSQGLTELLQTPAERLVGKRIWVLYSLAKVQVERLSREKAEELEAQQQVLEVLAKGADLYPDAQTFMELGPEVRTEWRGLQEVWVRATPLRAGGTLTGRLVTMALQPAFPERLTANTFHAFLERGRPVLSAEKYLLKRSRSPIIKAALHYLASPPQESLLTAFSMTPPAEIPREPAEAELRQLRDRLHHLRRRLSPVRWLSFLETTGLRDAGEVALQDVDPDRPGDLERFLNGRELAMNASARELQQKLQRFRERGLVDEHGERTDRPLPADMREGSRTDV